MNPCAYCGDAAVDQFHGFAACRFHQPMWGAEFMALMETWPRLRTLPSPEPHEAVRALVDPEPLDFVEYP